MSDRAEPPSGPSRTRGALLYTGAAGLLTAMATDALAVLGRHAGFALPGSIELFQMAAVVALSCAILLASVDRRHASVDLVLMRASEITRRRLSLAGDLALAITFALIAIASLAIVVDLWTTHEATEILALPVRPFRLLWSLAASTAAGYFAVSFVKRCRT